MRTLVSPASRFKRRSVENLSRSELLRHAALCVVASSLSPSAGVAAQDTDARSIAAQDAPETAFIQEVVVTARRRDEALIDVPISMTVFQEEALAARGAERLHDLQFAVPNFSFNSNGESSQGRFTIRGVTSRATSPGIDSGMGVYVDEVYLGRPVAFDVELPDVQSVEVLRGPQGTLFGRNNIAGAVNIRTRKPDDELRALLETQYGNFDTYRGKAMVSGQLVPEKLFGKVSMHTTQSDGFAENEFTGNKLKTEDTVGGRAQLRWVASDALEINARMDAQRDRRKFFFDELTADNAFGVPPVPGTNTVSISFDPREHRDLFGSSLAAAYSFANGATLTSISAYRDAENSRGDDVDASVVDALSNFEENEMKLFTQEIRLNSPDSGRLNYVAGVYYLSQDLDTLGTFPAGADLGIGPQVTTDVASVDTESVALFAHATYEMTQALGVFAGIRYTREKKELQFTQTLSDPILFFAFGLVPFGDTDETTDTYISPTIGINYAFNDTLKAYSTVSHGSKGGGWNVGILSVNAVGGPTTAQDIQFGAEDLTNYEVGLKSALLEGRAQLNAAVFYSDYRDLQVVQFNPITGIGEFTNAAKASVKGVELDMSAVVTDQLSLSAGIGYADAKFDRFENGGGVGVSLDGNRLKDAPRWTANASVEYTQPLTAAASLVLNLDYAYTGDMYFDNRNLEPEQYQGGFSIVNGRVALELDNGWVVSFWAKNLGDKTYATWRGMTLFAPAVASFAEPRTYGATVRWQFN